MVHVLYKILAEANVKDCFVESVAEVELQSERAPARHVTAI